MKKLYNLLFLLILFGCADEYESIDYDQEVILLPHIEGDDIYTRTELESDNITTSWKDGDKIGLQSKDLLDDNKVELNNKQITLHVNKDKVAVINDVFSWKKNEYGDANVYGFYPYNTKVTTSDGNFNNLFLSNEQFQKDENDKTHLSDLDVLFARYSGKKTGTPSLTFKHAFNLFEFQIKGEYKLKAIELQANLTDYVAFDKASYLYQDNEINNATVEGKKRKLTLTIQKEGGVQLEKDSYKSFYAMVGGNMKYIIDVALKFERPKDLKQDKTNDFLDFTTDENYIYYRFKLDPLNISNGGSKYTVSINGKDNPTISRRQPAYIHIDDFKSGTLNKVLETKDIISINPKIVHIKGEKLIEQDFEALKKIYNIDELDFSQTKTTVIPKNGFKDQETLYEITFPAALTDIGDDAFVGCEKLRVSSLPPNLEYVGERAFQGVKFINLIIPSTIIRVKKFAFNNVEISRYFNIYGTPMIDCKSDEWIFYSEKFCDINFKNIKNNLDKFFRVNYNESDGVKPMVFMNVKFHENIKEIPKLCSSESYTNKIGSFHFHKDVNFSPTENDYNYLADYAIVALHKNVSVKQNTLREFTEKSQKELSIYCQDNVTFEANSLKDVHATKIEVIGGTKTLSSNFLSTGTGVSDSIFLNINNDVPTMTVSKDMFADLTDNARTYVTHPGKDFKPISHKKLKVLQIQGSNIEDATSEIYRRTLFQEIILPYKITNSTATATVKNIKSYAFADCPNLNLILGLENVESLGSYIFKNTPNYTDLILSKVKNIGYYSLADSYINILNLKGSPLNGDVRSAGLANAHNLYIVNLTGSKFETIPDEFFYGDEMLLYCIFNEDDEIGELNSRRAGHRNRVDKRIHSSVTRIGTSAFEGCKSLMINIPNSVTILGERAFANCNNLIIDLREGLKEIWKKCFNNCPYLTYVNIPRSVKQIAIGAFKTNNPNHTLEVNFNWEDGECIEFHQDAWLYGNLVINLPNATDKNHKDLTTGRNYYSKGFARVKEITRSSYNKILIEETYKDGVPRIKYKDQNIENVFNSSKSFKNGARIMGDHMVEYNSYDETYYYTNVNNYDIPQYLGGFQLSSFQLISLLNLTNDILFKNPNFYVELINNEEFDNMLNSFLDIADKLTDSDKKEVIKYIHIVHNNYLIYHPNLTNDLGSPLINAPQMALYFPIPQYSSEILNPNNDPIFSHDGIKSSSLIPFITQYRSMNDYCYYEYVTSRNNNEYKIDYYKDYAPSTNVEPNYSSIPNSPVVKRDVSLVKMISSTSKDTPNTLGLILGGAGGAILIGIGIATILSSVFAGITTVAIYAVFSAASIASQIAAIAAANAAGIYIGAFLPTIIGSMVTFTLTAAVAVGIVIGIALILLGIFLALFFIFHPKPEFGYITSLFKSQDNYIYNVDGKILVKPEDIQTTRSNSAPTNKFLPAFVIGSDEHKKILEDMVNYDKYLERLNEMGQQLTWDENGNKIIVPLRPSEENTKLPAIIP
jgi:hypothetical protein